MIHLIVLVCLVLGAAAQGACDLVPDSDKVDCYPDPGSNPTGCLQRGCCWHVAPSRHTPFCFYPTGGGNCTGKPINGATLQRLFGPGGAGPKVLNPSSYFRVMIRPCNAITGCGPWQYDAWKLIMPSGMTIVNATWNVGITTNNVVQIWSVIGGCRSDQVTLSLSDGTFDPHQLVETSVSSGGCYYASFADGTRIAGLKGFVSTTCFSLFANYTLGGAPGGGTWDTRMWLNSNIIFP